MGASLALAGLSGCVFQPPEKIVPYVKQPEDSVPGKALFFATASSLGGIATPLLARSNEGRPTKIEGNPDHPNSRNGDPNDRGSSATDIFSQASILESLRSGSFADAAFPRRDRAPGPPSSARCAPRSMSNVRSKARECAF